jgi:hypothetical protein
MPLPLPAIRRLTLIAAAIAITTTALAGHNQTPDEQTVSVSVAPGQTVSGVLRVPAVTRPPVVCLVTDGDASALAAALAAERIASLRVTASSPDAVAQWISFLRNDQRFPLVTVFAEGNALAAGVIAGRAARADGIATRGDTTSASAELSRVVAAVKAVDAAGPADAARQIAAFARSVPALGRRGTSPARTVARRSLRHTTMATIGGVRVAIEWGQPQMRGREVWGTLVPWGRVWMPGADEATVLTTDGPLTIGKIDVPAGDHTIYTLPAADRLELLISRDIGQFHTVHDATLIIGRTDMSLHTKVDRTEGLTFAIHPGADGHADTVALSWDQREYTVTIATR